MKYPVFRFAHPGLSYSAASRLKAGISRAKPLHGVKTIEVPWAGKNSRFTLMFEACAIRVLQACETVSSGAKLLRLDWPRAHPKNGGGPAAGPDGRSPTTDGGGGGVVG